jgi:hypothetical protein
VRGWGELAQLTPFFIHTYSNICHAQVNGARFACSEFVVVLTYNAVGQAVERVAVIEGLYYGVFFLYYF